MDDSTLHVHRVETFFEGRLPNEWQAKVILVAPRSRAARVVTVGPNKGDVVWGRAMRPEETTMLTEDLPTASPVELVDEVKAMLIDLMARTWSFYFNSRMSELRTKIERENEIAHSLHNMALEVRSAGGWVKDIVDLYIKELGL